MGVPLRAPNLLAIANYIILTCPFCTQVVEQTYVLLREQGAVIEEPMNDDDEGDAAVLNEKLHISESLPNERGIIVQVPPPSLGQRRVPGEPGTSVGSVAEIRIEGNDDLEGGKDRSTDAGSADYDHIKEFSDEPPRHQEGYDDNNVAAESPR